VFWLELPLEIPGEQPPETAPARAESVQRAVTGPLRLLVADDVAVNRDIAQRFLASANHMVTCVEDGAQAVAAAASSDFDVVLMDVRMPEVDGLEATRQIRRLPGERGRVPIIGLTAQALAEQVAECTKAGMDAHVSKPFSPEVLFQAVARAAAEGHVQAAEASPMSVPVAVPATQAGAGTLWPVIDEEQLAKIAAILSAEELAATLKEIAERAKLLQGSLPEWEASDHSGGRFVHDVHRLAGTAAMYGFTRLAGAGQQFEYAIDSGAPDVQALTMSLRGAIEGTVEHIGLRVGKRAA
jgi:CheY-like chemotaxis protein/HPt (histidine-containing phosphotransfer) domain-containing protein